MKGLRRELTERRDLMTNQGVIESALDEILYRPRFPATVLIPTAGAAFGNAFGPPEYLAFPKAGTPAGRVTIVPPAGFWELGTLTLRLLWTGDAASTNNVEWAFNGTLTPLGSASTTITGPVADVPGPAVVGSRLSYTFTTQAFPVNASHAEFGLNIFRQATAGTDTYAGEARLFGFQVIYTPAAGH